MATSATASKSTTTFSNFMANPNVSGNTFLTTSQDQPTLSFPPFSSNSMRRTSLPWPHFAVDWSSNSNHFCTLAVGSFLPSLHNYIQVLTLPSSPSSNSTKESFKVIADALPIEYVPTKLMWSPSRIKNNEYLAASGNGVYVWRKMGEGGEEDEGVGDISFAMTGHLISKHGTASSSSSGNNGGNTSTGSSYGHGPSSRRASEGDHPHNISSGVKSAPSLVGNPPAPVTSFDWNRTDPTRLVTASYDTTCTVWCLETGTIRTQLIAHDKEVFDVAFNPSTTDTFVSVGADGSLRLFDIRSLDHSTILYENPEARPLLRVQWNAIDTNYLATLAIDSGKVIVMDVRMPSVPAAEVGHGCWYEDGETNLLNEELASGTTTTTTSTTVVPSTVVAMRWSPTCSSQLMIADERVVRLWDLADYDKHPRAKWAFDGMELGRAHLETPSMLEPIPLQGLIWPTTAPDWITLTSSDQVTVMRV